MVHARKPSEPIVLVKRVEPGIQTLLDLKVDEMFTLDKIEIMSSHETPKIGLFDKGRFRGEFSEHIQGVDVDFIESLDVEAEGHCTVRIIGRKISTMGILESIVDAAPKKKPSRWNKIAETLEEE